MYFPSSVSEILKAPVTEVVTLYDPPESLYTLDYDELKMLFKKAPGFLGFTQGATVQELGEDKAKGFQFLVAWETVKHHIDALKLDEISGAIGAAFDGTKKIEVHHIMLVAA